MLVVGGGQMGSGIAQVLAASGREVRLLDPQPGAIDRAFAAMEKSLMRLGLDPEEVLARIDAVEALEDADLLIEAVVEDAAVKEAVFRAADEALPCLLEIDVGGGKETEFGLDRFGAADALDLAFLNRPEQLRLEVEPQIADLVEKQRAAVASSNLPSCCRCAPVNAPRSCPKSSLSASSRGIAAQFTAMNGASGSPASRWISRASSSLPVPLSPRMSTVADSFAILCTRSTMSRAILLEPTTNSRSVCSATCAERQHLPIQVLPLAGVPHERSQLVVVEILGDVVIGAVLHGLHGGLNFTNRRDHDDLDQAEVLLDDPQHFEAADAGQADVEHHQIDVLAVEDRQRRLAARHAEHPVITLQDCGQRVPHPFIVVDDEDRFWLLAHRLVEIGKPRVLCQAVDTVASRSIWYEVC